MTISEITSEVNKVKQRVPKWMKNPNQINSRILIGYLKLAEQQNNVPVQLLRSRCDSVWTFYENYNQMKNFGEKNHGKVFQEEDGIISLWEPVKYFILHQYKTARF